MTEKDLFLKSFSDFLKNRGYDVENDENYIDTPKRVYSVFTELAHPKNEIIENARKILNKVLFPCAMNSGDPKEAPGMLLVKDVEVVTLCPHHLVPVLMRVGFGYIPGKKVVGLSKIPRYLKELGKALWLQEEYTQAAADLFVEEVECAGCMVIARGIHGCMRYRGIKEEDQITTSVVRGLFWEPQVRAEAMNLGI